MLRSLDTPYADTAAASLSFLLGGEPLPALDTLVVPDVAGPGSSLELRLLGASHQALLDTAAGRCAEVVACLPGAAPGLPSEVDTTVVGLPYRFQARIDTYGPADFRAVVADLKQRYSDNPRALIGVFPGAPDAVTALVALPANGGAVGWKTWHAYPQTGEVAVTRTSVVAR